MSRNLGMTCCDFCGGEVELVEKARPITPEEAGAYWDIYEGMIVANAHCIRCGTKYLAWTDSSQVPYFKSHPELRGFLCNVCIPGSFFDLSYRSTFDDEPGEADFVLSPWVREQLKQGWHAQGLLRTLSEALEAGYSGKSLPR